MSYDGHYGHGEYPASGYDPIRNYYTPEWGGNAQYYDPYRGSGGFHPHPVKSEPEMHHHQNSSSRVQGYPQNGALPPGISVVKEGSNVSENHILRRTLIGDPELPKGLSITRNNEETSVQRLNSLSGISVTNQSVTEKEETLPKPKPYKPLLKHLNTEEMGFDLSRVKTEPSIGVVSASVAKPHTSTFTPATVVRPEPIINRPNLPPGLTITPQNNRASEKELPKDGEEAPPESAKEPTTNSQSPIEEQDKSERLSSSSVGQEDETEEKTINSKDVAVENEDKAPVDENNKNQPKSNGETLGESDGKDEGFDNSYESSDDKNASEEKEITEESIDENFKKPTDESTHTSKKRSLSLSGAKTDDDGNSDSISDTISESSRHSVDFYSNLKNPVVGKDTLCIFCVGKCYDKRPKLLNCLHSTCSSCLDEKLKESAKNNEKQDVVVDLDGKQIDTEHSVLCPLCKIKTFENEVAPNLFIIAVEQGLDEESSDANLCNSCDERNPAFQWCNQCEEHLCEDCVKAHQRVKITKDHILKIVTPKKQSSSTFSSSSSFLESHRTCSIHTSEKLTLYCETCDKVTCRDCQLSESHRNHSHRISHDVSNDFKFKLRQTISDIKMKKNALDENRALLGTKLTEINIKERSLLTQLRDVEQFLISKIELRFKELKTEATKIILEKRKAIDNRKANLERLFQQADNSLAFVDHMISSNSQDDEEDLCILIAKRTVERQLRRLRKTDTSTGLSDQMSNFKLDAYFQQFSGSSMHEGLESCLKQLLGDLRVLSAPPEIHKELQNIQIVPAPQRMALKRPGEPSSSASPKIVQRASPAKVMSAANLAKRGVSVSAPKMVGRATTISPAGRGSQISGNVVRGRVPSGLSPVKAAIPAARGAIMPASGRGAGMIRTSLRSPVSQSVRGGATRGGVTSVLRARAVASSQAVALRGRTLMPATSRANPVRNAASSGANVRPRAMVQVSQSQQKAMISQQQMLMQQRQQQQPNTQQIDLRSSASNRVSHQQQVLRQGDGTVTSRPPALQQMSQITVTPQPSTPQQQQWQVQQRDWQRQQQQQQQNNYFVAAYGRQPQQQQQQMHPQQQQQQHYQVSYSQQQQQYQQPQMPVHPSVQQAAAQPSGSPSWHTPQIGAGISVTSQASNASKPSDTSFKITLPSINKATKPLMNIKTEVVDIDGAPIIQENESSEVKKPQSSVNPAQNAKELSQSEESDPLCTDSNSKVNTSNKSEDEIEFSPEKMSADFKEKGSFNVPDFSSITDDENVGSNGSPLEWMNIVNDKINKLSNAHKEGSSPKSQDNFNNEESKDPPTTEVESSHKLSGPIKEEQGSVNKRKVNEVIASESSTIGGGGSGNDADDWCAVCHDGGDVQYCCDRCPKVYHLYCYIPPMTSEPPDDWVCLMCATVSEISQYSNNKEGGNLGERDLRICRRLLFELYNQYPQSVSFKDCSDLNFPEYLAVVKEPIALDVIKERLDVENPEQYSSVEEFLADVRRMFKNCYLFHDKDTEWYQHAKELEEFLDKKLEEWLPDLAYDQTVINAKNKKKRSAEPSPSPGPSKKKKRSENSVDSSTSSLNKKKKKKKKKKTKRRDSEVSKRSRSDPDDEEEEGDEADEDEEDDEEDDGSLSEGEKLDFLDSLEAKLDDNALTEEEDDAKIKEKKKHSVKVKAGKPFTVKILKS